VTRQATVASSRAVVFDVDLTEKTCTCGVPLLDNMPCVDMIAALEKWAGAELTAAELVGARATTARMQEQYEAAGPWSMPNPDELDPDEEGLPDLEMPLANPQPRGRKRKGHTEAVRKAVKKLKAQHHQPRPTDRRPALPQPARRRAGRRSPFDLDLDPVRPPRHTVSPGDRLPPAPRLLGLITLLLSSASPPSTTPPIMTFRF